MPASYNDSYEFLDKAKNGLDGLVEKTDLQERYACLRIAFYQLYQAVRVASMCFEVSNYEGAAAQGGSFSEKRDELGEFLQMSQSCQILLDLEDKEIRTVCDRWINRAKSFVEATRADEARATNMQYARIPD